VYVGVEKFYFIYGVLLSNFAVQLKKKLFYSDLFTVKVIY